MLTITNLYSDTLPLIDTSQPERIRDIDGTHTLNLTVRETDINSVAFAYIENEAILNLDGDKYVIKNIKPHVISDTVEYEIEAVHKFIHDLSAHRVYDIIPNRKILSLHKALTHILPKDYTFIIENDFDNESYENFGDDTALSLFEKIRVDYNFEYIKDGTHLKIYKQIGNKTNKQMRYKHNIINISGGLNSMNLATYIEGVGKPKEDAEGNVIEGEYLAQATYTSPLADMYGIIHAKPVDDERFHNKPELLEYMKSKLNDTIDISYDIIYDEFIKAIDDNTDADLGDSIYLIHEVLKENFQTRIVSIIDFPLSDTLKPIYTISSKKESIVDRQVQANTDKKNLEGKVENIDKNQSEFDKRIEDAQQAVDDVNNTIDTVVIPEMERLENEVIPEIEQAIENTSIPSQVDPPYPIPKSGMWNNSSVNPPRLMRWDSSIGNWVILAPTESEIDDLMEQMKQDAINEGKSYSDAEITATRQAIINQLNKEINDVNANMTIFETDLNGITQRVTDTEAIVDTHTDEIISATSKIGELEVTSENITSTVSDISADLVTANQAISQVEQTAGRIESTVSEVRTDLDGLEIGGRNYLPKSDIEKTTSGFYIDYSLSEDKRELAKTKTVVSFEAKHSAGSNPVTFHVYYRKQSGGNIGFSHGERKSTTIEYQRFVIPIDEDKIPDDMTDYTDLYIRKDDNTNEITIRNVQLEKGNKATDWREAPGDMDARMTAVQTTITQLPDQINLAVSTGIDDADLVGKANVLSSINLSTEGIKIQAPKIDITGLVEFVNNKQNIIPMHPSYWEMGGTTPEGQNGGTTGIRTIDYIQVEPNTLYSIDNTYNDSTSPPGGINILEFGDNGFIKVSDLITYNTRSQLTTSANTKLIRIRVMIPPFPHLTTPDKIGDTFRMTMSKGSSYLSWDDSKSTIINGGHIVTNNITANQLNVNSIFSNSAVISKIQADSVLTAKLSATQIDTGTLNASNVSVINLSASVLNTGTLNTERIGARSITADKIALGTITASNGIIASLDVNKLVGNTSNFVQSTWNNLSNTVKVSATGLETYSSTTRTSLLNGNGHTFYRDEYSVGLIGTNHLIGSNLRGLTFNLEHDAHYMSWSAKDSSASNYNIKMAWYRRATSYNNNISGFNFNDDITINSANALAVRKLTTTGYTGADKGIILQAASWNSEEGVFIRRSSNTSDNGGGVFMTMNKAVLRNNGTAHIEVRADNSGNQILTRDIYNRTYTQAPNMHVTSHGTLGRSTSSRRYKLLEEPISLEYAKKILDVDMKSWFDKNTAEGYAQELSNPDDGLDYEQLGISRLPGFIAEDIHDIGLTMFVDYNEDDLPDAISNNLPMLSFPILKDHDARIEELEKDNNNLLQRIDQLEQLLA